MAVETVYGKFLGAPLQGKPMRGGSDIHQGIPYKPLIDAATIPGAASVASVIVLGSVPSRSVISRLGYIAHAALGAGVTLDVGVQDDATIGLTGQGDILVDGEDSAAADSFSVAAGVSYADNGKPLWQLAGLSEDPLVEMTLIATIGGAAVSAGDKAITWEIPYTSY